MTPQYSFVIERYNNNNTNSINKDDVSHSKFITSWDFNNNNNSHKNCS